MRVLVTGSSGRIGSEVTQLFQQAGHSVVGLDITPPTRNHPDEFHQGAVVDFTPEDAVYRHVDAAIHLGACMSWSPDDTAAVFKAGTDTTFHLLHALSGQPLQRFIFASTGDAYPESAPTYLPLDEHHPLLPRSIYGLTKALGENIVEFFARTTQLPTVILRFPATYDPSELLDPENRFAGSRFLLHLRHERELRLGNRAFAEELQKALDQAKEALTLVAVQDPSGVHARMTISTPTDVARAIVLALEHPSAPGQTIGVGPDEAIDLFDFAHSLGEATGLPVMDVTAPTVSDYWTLNAKARELLGFKSDSTAATILTSAAEAWHARHHDT